MEQDTTTQFKSDVYEIITNRIIAQMEVGIVPWRIPWTRAGLPQNLISKRPYTGINVWMLASLGYIRNLFLTFKQLKEIGGNIKKGEKACPVIYWNWQEKPDEGKTTKKAFLRYYMVFNIEQCENVPADLIPEIEGRQNDTVANCEQIIEGYATCPIIYHKGVEAFYHPGKDIIQMPPMTEFIDSEHYYGTLFHELVHSTGHPNRLNRKELNEPTNFGSKQYSQEELVAEMGASFLTSIAGIGDKPFGNHVAYIQNWLTVLKNDKHCIIIASGKAQHAVDYILHVPTNEDEVVSEVNEKRVE